MTTDEGVPKMEKKEVHTKRPKVHKTTHKVAPKQHAPKKATRRENLLSRPLLALIAAVALVVIFNQLQINAIGDNIRVGGRSVSLSGGGDLGEINLEELHSTAHTLQAVMPVDQIQTQEDAIAVLIPTGTPDYGEALGVSYDDPVSSLNVLARMYNPLKAEVQQNDPVAWENYLKMASNPVGVSCEYCCGIGPTGADKRGNSRCGCQHNPALLSLALYLNAYTDYTDGEILREVIRWKTLFFPRNMVELGVKLGGGDTSVLDSLPGMVGGC